jgi:hypothetical protein
MSVIGESKLTTGPFLPAFMYPAWMIAVQDVNLLYKAGILGKQKQIFCEKFCGEI